MLAGAKKLMIYTDDASLKGSVKVINGKRKLSISIPQNGGVVINTAE